MGVRSRRVRSIAFQFARFEQLVRALDEGDFELDLPRAENVADGEWVLALFEIDGGSHGTAAAGKAVVRGSRVSLRFTERDWERLIELARTASQELDGDRCPTRIAAVEAARVWAEAPPPSTAAPLPDRISGIGARVLVVDDEPIVRDMLAAMLEDVGLLVDTAADAEEALERLRSRRYDVALIDGQLPGMSGVDLCRALRVHSALRKLPVLFLTSSSSSRDMAEAFSAGADDYMMKPFRAPELGARIFGLLRRAMSIPLTG